MRRAHGVVTLLEILVTACGAIACSTTSHRTAAERQADEEIAAGVQAALLADPYLYARHIDVEVVSGVVHLGGYVWEDGDFQKAQRDAASVLGVKAVRNEMELIRGGISGTSR